jgi:hypothetical protein
VGTRVESVRTEVWGANFCLSFFLPPKFDKNFLDLECHTSSSCCIWSACQNASFSTSQLESSVVDHRDDGGAGTRSFVRVIGVHMVSPHTVSSSPSKPPYEGSEK